MNKSSSNTKLNDTKPAPTPREMLTPIFRHPLLVLGVFLSLFLFAVFVAWFGAARYYVSEMQVVVAQVRTDPAITSGQNAAVGTYKGVAPDQISSEIALLKGQDILRKVAETCGLGNSLLDRLSTSTIFLPNDPSRVKAARIQNAANKLEKGVKAEAEKVSDVITVKYGALGDPQTPACVLQNIGKLYLDKHLQMRRSTDSTNFFAEQTEKYRQELAGVEARLTGFSRAEGVAAPDELRTDVAQQVAASMAELHQAQQQAAGDEERLKADEAQLQNTPARITTQQSSNAANLLMQQLETTLLNAQLKRSQLAVKYDASFPLVREADEEIAKTQAAIQKAKEMNYADQTTDLNPTYQLLQQDIARTRLDLATQKANAAAIADSINTMRAQMVDLDGMSVKQTALLREEKADESNYLLYLNKREQARTSDALDLRGIADVAIAVPPVPAALPAFNPILVGFGGLILAILAAIASAFAAEWMDPSFRTPDEVTKTLKIPVLAAVPWQAA
jgi:uncharacterized protein involved in exopolysaccharide biosynthesis